MHENVSIEKYGRGTGRVLVTGADLPLDVLDPQEVVRELATAGFLVFRGFDTGVTAFNAFVDKLSWRRIHRRSISGRIRSRPP